MLQEEKMVRKLFLISLMLVLVLSGSTIYAQGPNPEPANNGKITWPTSQALPSFAKPKHLDVVDIEKEPGDVKLLFATLQGNINRERPRIYLFENVEEGKYTWLNDLKVPYTEAENPWNVLYKYKDEIDGMVIYDPDVPDTVNVATTYAGLENAVVVSPELAARLQRKPFSLEIIKDFRGQFEDGLEAYQWQFEHLWPRTTHRMLIGLSPTKGVPLPEDNFDSFETLLVAEEVRDSSNRGVYDIDLTDFLGEDAVYLRFQDAYSGDGWGPAVHEVTVKADGEVIAQFIPGTESEETYLYDADGSNSDSRFDYHRWADGGAYFVYEFNPPANTDELTVSVDMWNQFKVSASNVKPVASGDQEPYGFLRDYAVANKAMVFWLESNLTEEKALFEEILSATEPNTPYLGWFGNDVAGEFSGTELASKHGNYVLAADWFNNMTVFSGAKGKIKKQKPVAAPELENKIYITFTLGEGDNLQYNQHRMRIIWDDERRGSVPINWTTSPLLYDVAPSILGHFQQTATDNDLLIVGPSGAGYIYPNVWPDETFHTFAKQTGKYMKKTGMDIIYALNREDHRDVMLTEQKAQAYIDYANPNGIFIGWDNYSETTILNGKLPQSILLSASSVGQAKEVIARETVDWDGESPLFVAMGMLAWSIGPSEIEEIVNSLGEEFEVVRGDQYFELVREANGLPKK